MFTDIINKLNLLFLFYTIYPVIGVLIAGLYILFDMWNTSKNVGDKRFTILESNNETDDLEK